MKFWGLIALVLSFILVINLVFAFENDFPSKVTVEQDRTNLSFVVTNTLPYAIDFTAELFVPSNYQFVGLPKTIRANSSKQINLTVFFNPEISGLSYNGKIVFYAGNERISKNFAIFYKGNDSDDTTNIVVDSFPSGTPTDSNNFDSNNAIAGFVSVFSKPSLELVLVIVLIFIAAILLIAFVSRFVKRIQK